MFFFYLISIFFYKVGEQEGKTGSAGVEGSGKGKGRGGRTQCKKYVHMYVNAKMILAETIPGIGGGDK
jgi:hypothetical protein